MRVVGSSVVSPDRSLGVRRLQELKQKIKDLDVICVFSEPQFDTQIVNIIVEGTDARIGTLDPIGADLDDGSSLYELLLRNMATSFKSCLSAE